MNINSGISSNYSGNHPYGSGGGHVDAQKKGDDTKDEISTTGRKSPKFSASDSLTAFSAPNRYSYATERDVDEKKMLLRKLRRMRKFLTAVTFLSILLFFMAASQPLLVMILTLGDVFQDGTQDWIEFSLTALKLSVIPATVALFSWIVRFTVKRYHRYVKVHS